MSEQAPYAADPTASRGRLFAVSGSPTRSEFQRDRDRIIHSTAFRRLQYKTQVFLHHEGQHFRTRLTHTLEVSQMARSIARALRLNEDLAEAVALAHDLGHTPFGHAGERVLHQKMAEFGGFDHNMQATRVVTRLENRYAEHDGLNLSWETLEGILKHNGPLVDEDERPVGRYVHEWLPFGLYDIPASADLMLSTYASLEAQSAAIADDIAYNAHDIDDALRAGLLQLPDLVDVPLVGPFVREVLERWPNIERGRQAHEIQRRLITRAIEDVIATAEAEIEDVAPSSADHVRYAGRSLIHFSPATSAAEMDLKAFMFERVYRSEPVMVPVRRSETLVAELFDRYFATGDMPGRWGQAALEAASQSARARVVADFIAGMTDPYAEAEHARLFDGQRAVEWGTYLFTGPIMDIFADFAARVAAALKTLYPEASAELIARAVVEPPRDAAHGDLSSNAAMVVAKPLGKNPREIAATLAEHFKSDPDVASVEVAGPGFLNFRLDEPVWHRVLKSVDELGAGYGKTDIGKGDKVNVEYVSANPTGPMHVGHTRGAVFGDALASLLDYVGYEVTREYYINDAGGQVDILARSAFLRYREALGETIEIPPGYYPGDYLKPVGERLADAYGRELLAMPEAEWLPKVKELTLKMMMELIRTDLANLGVKHDVFFSEKTLHGQGGDIDLTLQWLRDQNLVYQGRLDPPKGQVDDDYEDREQTLFRAKDFGDDVDRPLIKSDGSYTYFAADIAYHRNKYLRGFKHMINVFGADHSGYVSRLKAAVKAVSGGEADVDVKIMQLVRLLKNGEPFKMSKRSGDLVLLSDVVEEVGVDATRFMLLYRRNEQSMDFDFALVKEHTRDNPVFYVQYAHARTCSVFRTAETELPALDLSEAELSKAPLELLVSPADIELIKAVAQWPRMVTAAALAHEPHRIAFYLYELAAAFHSFWAKGKDDRGLRFVNPEDLKLTVARLALVGAVRQVLVNGLTVLGVSAPDELS